MEFEIESNANDDVKESDVPLQGIQYHERHEFIQFS